MAVIGGLHRLVSSFRLRLAPTPVKLHEENLAIRSATINALRP